MKMPKEMLNESLAANLERQKEFFDSVSDYLRRKGFGNMEKCSESADEIPEMVMATAANYLVDACGIKMDIDDAIQAASGPFRLGVYIGLKMRVNMEAKRSGKSAPVISRG